MRLHGGNAAPSNCVDTFAFALVALALAFRSGRGRNASARSQNYPLAGYLCPSPRGALMRLLKGIDADDPTIGPSRPQDEAVEDEDARAEGLAPAQGCLYPRVHDDAEEAQLGPSEGRARTPDRRFGGQRLHPRRRSQPAGALDRAGA